MVYYQNPPDKTLYFRYLLVYLKKILFIFHYYPYPQLVNGSQN